jgi:hypothetical protein
VEYYQHDLALIHARGFGQHADRCAPGVLDLLAPVRGGLVLEIGGGGWALTRRERARRHVRYPGAAGFARRDGHGADVVRLLFRRRGATARDARRDRGQNLTPGPGAS